MIPQTYKDQVARKYGYSQWDMIIVESVNRVTGPSDLEMLEEAALLYAQSKWNEACEEQRNKCCEEYMAIDVYDHTNKFETLDREMNAIKFAPKPEFKP